MTDSAASGTGWATGVKTVLEPTRKSGCATGNVTTAELTDATPAVLDPHVTDRPCHGPADTIAVNGPGPIAEQSVNHNVDVLKSWSTTASAWMVRAIRCRRDALGRGRGPGQLAGKSDKSCTRAHHG